MKDVFTKYQAAELSRKKLHAGRPGKGDEPESYKRRKRARKLPFYVKGRMK